MGDTLELCKDICLSHKPQLILTSPPYGDNQTTVTYGQYSLLPLRWIDLQDINENIDDTVVSTICEIDNRSLGGKKKKIEANLVRQMFSLSPTLKNQSQLIESIDNTKVNKVVNFYYDMLRFLNSINSVSSGTYVLMIVGNRTVAKTKIRMDDILKELFLSIEFDFICKFDRKISRKRMSVINKTDKISGEKIESMTRESVLITRKR